MSLIYAQFVYNNQMVSEESFNLMADINIAKRGQLEKMSALEDLEIVGETRNQDQDDATADMLDLGDEPGESVDHHQQDESEGESENYRSYDDQEEELARKLSQSDNEGEEPASIPMIISDNNDNDMDKSVS